MTSRIARFGMMGLFLMLASCTSAPKISEPRAVQDTQDPSPANSSQGVHPSSLQIIEAKMKHTKGSQILISKQLLRKLIQEEKTSELARNRLNGQIEALKKVDREEPQKFVQ